MQVRIIDSESIYQRLLAANNAQEREVIYRRELLEPFAVMMGAFGGDDPLALAKMWGFYAPEDFDGKARASIEELLDGLAASGAWGRFSAALERGVAAFAPFASQITLGTITCTLVLTDARRANPLDRGYSGFGGIPGYVMVSYSQANEYSLQRVEGATVHELNHNVRFRAFPFHPNITGAEYIVAEGLAESFAAELYGEGVVGYYVTDLSEEEATTAKRVIADALDVSGFNTVRGYIFGDVISEFMGRPKTGVPNFAGYAMGYRAVQRYLQRTGKSVVEATFVPASEIIGESGFFQ